MKRLLPIFCALILLLPGCGQSGEKEPELFTTDQVQALAEGGAFSEELEELDADVAFALYHLSEAGLDQEAVTECAVLRSAGATCEEGAVLIFTDKDSAQTAKAALADYLESQIDSNRNYRPNEIPKLENALVECRGSTVALVIAEDLKKAKEILEIK